jgi:hypothetical protein
MKNIWVIGGGKFGLKAAGKVRKKNPDCGITVVEKDEDICRRLNGEPFRVVCSDGVDYLFDNLQESGGPDWIVPAIPKHVAFEWIRKKLTENFRLEVLPVPGQLVATLPNPIRGKNNEIYVSNADFICPEHCPEPYEICTHTGKARQRILHKFIEITLYDNFYPVVIVSRQLCPGVGGYSPQALFQALEAIVTAKAPILLSTACRCHGVMHAFRVNEI